MMLCNIQGNKDDIRHWLGEWTALCCKAGMHAKVRWLADQLIAGPDNVSLSAAEASSCSLSLRLVGGGINASALLKECILPSLANDLSNESLLTEIHQAVTFKYP